MPDPSAYPGSASLSVEARSKVFQTFKHTLDLARSGRNEEALLGCDFILKMDGRFVPAKKLLEALRGVASGTVVDLSAFDDFEAPAPAEPAAAAAPARPAAPPPTPARGIPAPAAAPERPAAPPPTPPSGLSASPAATVAVPSLSPQSPAAAAWVDPFAAPAAPPVDNLGFDAFASSDPFAAAPAAPAPAPFAPAPALPDSFAAPPLPSDPFAAPSPFGAPPPLASPPAASSTAFAPPAPAPDPFAAPPAFEPPTATSPFGRSSLPPDPFGSPSPFSAPPATSLPADPFAAVPAAPSFDFGFGGVPAAPSGPAGFGDMGFGAPPPFAPTEAAPTPAPAAAEPFAAPAAAPAPGLPHVDPRITQFLRQGDEAMARGAVQEAIDLWSRVFLIDLSNDDASRRIDAAREKQSQTAQAIDALLAEGIQLFDAGDLHTSRAKFLDVLALSETDGTARHYLNQIDANLAAKEIAAPAPARSADAFAEDYGAPTAREALDLGEPEYKAAGTGVGSEAAAEGEPERAAAPRKAGGIDARILIPAGLVLLAVIGFGAFQLLKSKPAPPLPAAGPAPGQAPAPVGEDLIAKAQGLFDQGKVDDALQILVSIPPAHPRHTDALALIDRFKSTAIPTPPAAAPSDASLDEMRVAGLAAVKASRYIDAVKALDPVVKARPDDAEAMQALTRAREELAALSAAIKAYNEQDYGSAIKLLWDLRKKEMKNQDVEEFLFKSYFNEGIQGLQAGNFRAAAQSFQEASQLRPQDAEAKRHARFAGKYGNGATDLLSRIYVKHATPRP